LDEVFLKINGRIHYLDVENLDPIAAPSPEAKEQLAKLPANFSKGDLYIDYVFPK